MPRARAVTTEEEVVGVAPKKRAPRKRAAAPVVATEEGAAPAPRPRTRRPRKVAATEPVVADERSEERVPAPVAESSGRRAPTPLASERVEKMKQSRTLLVVASICLLVTGAGVFIGLSDAGEINVVAVVNERNERVNRGEVREGESQFSVPVQNADARPNGGLVPLETPPAPTPSPADVPPIDTASTTDTQASSTAAEGVSSDEEPVADAAVLPESEAAVTDPAATADTSEDVVVDTSV